MALCHLAAGEIFLLILLRSIGMPDVISFTLFGMIVITIAYWLDGIISNKGITLFGKALIKKQKRKYQKIMLVGICFIITIIAYWLLSII